MQADRGFVQHIENAGQAGADLRGQADALAFAARQGARAACQGQVVQPDIVEEFQAGADFLQDARGDLLLLLRQLLVDALEPGVGIANRHFADLADMDGADLHRQRFGLEAIALADLARCLGLIAFKFLLHPGAVGFAEAPFHVGNDAFEFLFGVIAAHAVVIGELDHLLARAMQDHLFRLFGQVLPGIIHAELVVPRQRFQRLQVIRRG